MRHSTSLAQPQVLCQFDDGLFGLREVVVELLDGVTGRLVDGGEPLTWSLASNTCTSSPCDWSLRERPRVRRFRRRRRLSCQPVRRGCPNRLGLRPAAGALASAPSAGAPCSDDHSGKVRRRPTFASDSRRDRQLRALPRRRHRAARPRRRVYDGRARRRPPLRARRFSLPRTTKAGRRRASTSSGLRQTTPTGRRGGRRHPAGATAGPSSASDPGERPGIAVLSGDTVVAAFQVPAAKAAEEVRREVEDAVDPVVRIGDGARLVGARLVDDLTDVPVELVDETGTTPYLGTGARGWATSSPRSTSPAWRARR